MTGIEGVEVRPIGVAVNEVRVNAVGGGAAAWWSALLQVRRHVVCQQTIAGGIIWLPCSNAAHANATAEMLVVKGLPASAVTTAVLLDGSIQPADLHLIGCRMRGLQSLPVPPEEP